EVSAKERSGWLGATEEAEQVTGSVCAILFFVGRTESCCDAEQEGEKVSPLR
ncbi:hypothetical protein LEMLEM_LOCUS23989, partial [Lemmus lemmus]